MHRARVLTAGWTCLWVRQSARTTPTLPAEALRFYLPDMPYQPYPSQELPWVKEVETATDAIEGVMAFLAGAQAFAPYIHGGLELPGQTPDTLKDHDNWTAAFLIRDGAEHSSGRLAAPRSAP